MNDIPTCYRALSLLPITKASHHQCTISSPSYKITEDVALDTLDTLEEKENTTLDNKLGLTFPNLAEPGTTAQEEPRKSITNKPISKQASLTQPSPPPTDEPEAIFLFGNVHTPIPVH